MARKSLAGRVGAGRTAFVAIAIFSFTGLLSPVAARPPKTTPTPTPTPASTPTPTAGTYIISPGQSIQAAINSAKPGDTIYLRGGTYREELNFSPSGTSASRITLMNYGSEVPIIKGSDVASGWVQHSGGIWKKTGWSIDSQQVFDNGAPLQQIGQPSNYSSAWEYRNAVGGINGNLTNMSPGTFYNDRANGILYVWLNNSVDPNQRLIETSTRRRVLIVGGQYVTIKGINFRHSNTGAYADTKQNAMVELGSNCSIINCDIQYGDFAGLSMGWEKSNGIAENCNVSNNGDVGINAPRSYNFTVRNGFVA